MYWSFTRNSFQNLDIRISNKIILTMSILTKLRCITLDVTGTLIAYKGELGDYYCMAAKSVGLPCPDYKRMHEGFKIAYTTMAKEHPCFGYADKIPNIIWWKTCVRDSFIKVTLLSWLILSQLLAISSLHQLLHVSYWRNYTPVVHLYVRKYR